MCIRSSRPFPGEIAGALEQRGQANSVALFQRSYKSRSALIQIPRNDQNVSAGRGQRANFSRIVGLAVFMGGVDGDLAARAGTRAAGRRDELGDLARDFDRMADRVQALLEEQQRIKSELDAVDCPLIASRGL